MYPSIFNHFWNITWQIQGAAAPIDLTNYCINVKSHLRMHQNPPFSGEIHFFLGKGGAQNPPKTPSLDRPPPHYKVLDPPLHFMRYSGIAVASDWFSTVYLWANERFLTTFCFPLGTPLGQSGKCYMDRKRIQCLLNASEHVPIYRQPFFSQ